MTQEVFSLSGDPRNNYVNLILNDIKNFNYARESRRFNEAIRALGILLLDLPPAGQEFMKQEVELMYAYENNVSLIRYWLDINHIYQKAMTWIWPNLLQEYFQAKPRNPQPMILGETK